MGVGEDVTEALSDWRQGDVVLGPSVPFVWLVDPRKPLSPHAEQDAIDDPPQGKERLRQMTISEHGFAIVSQSCDLVLNAKQRPYVEIAPLVEVTVQVLAETKKGMRSAFAYLEPIAESKLVVDIDRVQTIEKSVLAGLSVGSRIVGCESDHDRARFAAALARKRNRFAFPDDFVGCIRPIQARIKAKLGKATHEGALLDRLDEIRIRTLEDWEAFPVETEILFIFPPHHVASEEDGRQMEILSDRFAASAKYPPPQARIVSLDRMSAELYLSSHPLDLDHLSN